MSETNSTGLRKLAHRHYTGELSYEAYRSKRTRLLDRLTQQSAYEMTTSKAQPMLEKTQVMPVSSRRRRPVLVLIVLMLMIAVLVWLLKSGRITLSLAETQFGVTATSGSDPEISRLVQRETLRTRSPA